MRSALAAIALVVLYALGTVAAGAECKVRAGDHVVLYGSADDPSVLVWDSRFRLRDYHAASFDEAQMLAPHALLASPGTRATVESCVPDFVTSRLFNKPIDAVGVIVVGGHERGRSGWVLGTDIRGIYHPMRH